MGSRWRALFAVVAVCAGARAQGSVQVDPIARLALAGGYDSNVMYDGRGGDQVAVVSPDLGLRIHDELFDFRGSAGGDLLQYRNHNDPPVVWNQRGRLALEARPGERWTLHGDLSGTYAPDPIGLAKMGIFGRTGAALIASGSARLGYQLDPRWRVAGTFSESLVRFDAGDGAASHEPGIELTRQMGRRTELGAGYRFDYFQGLGPGATDATAHELAGIARWHWSRRLLLEVTAGPALWFGPHGEKDLLPQGGAQLVWMGRHGDARLSFHHGVGLGNLATPGLFDSLEAGFTTIVMRHLQLHGDGGVWRAGTIPWGENGVIGYGVEGEVAWLLGGGFRVGIAGSRFARADTADPTFDRDIVGLRIGWELQQH